MATPNIMLIVNESYGYNDINGSGSAPNLNNLANTYAKCTQSYGFSHPSLPNYIAMICGSTQGTDGSDNQPGTFRTGLANVTTLFNQLQAAGISWKTYFEDLPSPGYTNDIDGSDSEINGNFLVHHDALAYFDQVVGSAGDSGYTGTTIPPITGLTSKNVSLGTAYSPLISDLNGASPPNFVLVVGNTLDDGHDGYPTASGLSACDTWTYNLVQAVQATSWYAAGGIIIIEWDEDNDTVGGSEDPQGWNNGVTSTGGGGHVMTIVINEAIKGLYPSGYTTGFNTVGLLGSIEAAYGLTFLGSAGNASNGNIKPLLNVAVGPGAPTVTSLSVTTGPSSGGTSTVIHGTNFTNVTAVHFGTVAVPSANYTVNSATQITVSSTPAGTGVVDVTVTTTVSTSATSSADQFTYTAPPGSITPVGGWTQVAATGNTTLSVNPQTVGDLMVVYAKVPNTSISLTSVSGGGVSTWTKGVQFFATAVTEDMEIWFGKITTPGPSTITFTWSASVSSLITECGAQEFTAGFGSSTVWALDTSGTINNTSSSTVSFPPLTPANTGELYVGYCWAQNNSAAGSTAGFTYTLTPNVNINTYDPNVSSAVSPTATQSPAGNSAGVAVLIHVSNASPLAPTVSAVSPNTGIPAGGTQVAITGTNFSNVSAVHFGANLAQSFTVNSPTSMTAVAPAGAIGTVDITVTTPNGTSATSTNDHFTYTNAVTVDVTVTGPGGTSAQNTNDRFQFVANVPTISSVAPSSGPTGTSVLITGQFFTGVTTVRFGTVAASFTFNSDTQITATVPAGVSGSTTITVTTTQGTSSPIAFTVTTTTTKPLLGWWVSAAQSLPSGLVQQSTLDYGGNKPATNTYSLSGGIQGRLQLSIGFCNASQAQAIVNSILPSQPDAIIRIAWEFNGGYTFGNWDSGQMSGPTYVSNWQSTVTNFRNATPVGGVDTSGFKYFWCGQGQPDISTWIGYYPGDAYVDLIGDDRYDATTISAQQSQINNLIAFAKSRTGGSQAPGGGKYLGFGEWGMDNSVGGDDPAYVNMIASYVNNPANNFYGHWYFSATTSQGVSFDSTLGPNSMAAYQSAFAGT
jgi:hypothetical protein